tara:strand:- start:330 stop:1370 length:1041 start_codon:yes stop_codon:yes gene_type:complete
MKLNKKLNVIYIVASEKGISGGEKVIYRHSDMLNKYFKNISSEIIPLKKNKISKYKNSFFKILKQKNKFTGWSIEDIEIKTSHNPKFDVSNPRFRNKFSFNKKKDFIILPEIFAHLAKDLLITNQIPYAIFVQNGYALDSTNNFKMLDEAYKHAKLILSVSDDTTKMINHVYGRYSKDILKLNLAIGSDEIKENLKKQNLITYMPRKLPMHSQKLIFLLRNKLPSNWNIKALENISDFEFYNFLRKSKLFLSFSYMEGLGAPPIEAAKEGNKVIGYTGEGGKDYWKKPIFTEIPNGNLDLFMTEIMQFINSKKPHSIFLKQRVKLLKKYSTKSELKSLRTLINKII